MDHPLFFLAYRRMTIFVQEWFFYAIVLTCYYRYEIHQVRHLFPLLIIGGGLIMKDYWNLGIWEDQLKIHHDGTPNTDNISWQYLSFRHTMVSLDTWFFVNLMVWLIYCKKETSWLILGPVLVCGIIFNLIGYYYLNLLEKNYLVEQQSGSQYFSIYSS